jgi:hypothetical protein
VRGDQIRGTGPRPRPLSSRESRRVRSARPSSDGSGPGDLPALERQTEEYAEWLASRAESVSAGGSSTDASLPPPRIVVVVDPFRYDQRRPGRQRHDPLPGRGQTDGSGGRHQRAPGRDTGVFRLRPHRTHTHEGSERQLRRDRSALRGATVPTFGDAGGAVVSAGAGGAELADQLGLGGVQVSG